MLSATSYWCAARSMAAGLPVAANRSSATLRKARRPAPVASGEYPPDVVKPSYVLVSAGPSRSPISARNAVRARKIASGSISRPISRAMSLSPGGISESAMKAGSRVESPRIAARATISFSSAWGSRPARKAATLSMSRFIEIDCSACQRLNGSLSWAARKARSSALRLVMSFIGAENPRLIDNTGHSARSSNSKVAAGWLSTATPPSIALSDLRGRSRPFLPTKPIDSGITIASLRG